MDLDITLQNIYFKDIIDCAICKNKHGGFFMVEDGEWFGVVPKEMEDKIICWQCYSKIREEKSLKRLEFEDYRTNKKSNLS